MRFFSISTVLIAAAAFTPVSLSNAIKRSAEDNAEETHLSSSISQPAAPVSLVRRRVIARTLSSLPGSRSAHVPGAFFGGGAASAVAFSSTESANSNTGTATYAPVARVASRAAAASASAPIAPANVQAAVNSTPIVVIVPSTNNPIVISNAPIPGAINPAVSGISPLANEIAQAVVDNVPIPIEDAPLAPEDAEIAREDANIAPENAPMTPPHMGHVPDIKELLKAPSRVRRPAIQPLLRVIPFPVL